VDASVPLAFGLDFDRAGHGQTQSLRDHLPVRVTDRASLAGNVSRSSSSSRWSARCQSPLSSAGLVAGALFRAALLSDAWDWLAEVFIGKKVPAGPNRQFRREVSRADHCWAFSRRVTCACDRVAGLGFTRPGYTRRGTRPVSRIRRSSSPANLRWQHPPPRHIANAPCACSASAEHCRPGVQLSCRAV
jgi:hypothetical protein